MTPLSHALCPLLLLTGTLLSGTAADTPPPPLRLPATPVVTVRPHALSWTHSVAFDPAGLATADASFDVSLQVHADQEILLGCMQLRLSKAVTNTGEVLVQIPSTFDWSQGSEEPAADVYGHLSFKLPQQPATTLTLTGTLLAAPAAALRFVDLVPLSSYLGRWAAVQGLPAGALQVYRLNDVVWLQFSPGLREVFQCIHYASVDGDEVDIVDWNASEVEPPAYSNDVSLADEGRVSVGYLDPSRSMSIPFDFPHLPLDGKPLDRSAVPATCELVAPSRSAKQPAASSALPVHGSSEKF